MFRPIAGVVALVLASGTACAGLMFESEPNNNSLDADDLPTFTVPGGSVAVDGEITAGVPDLGSGIPGDVDWYKIVLTGDSFLGVSVFNTDPGRGGDGGGKADGDPALQIVNDDMDVIAFNDDAFGLNPSWGGYLPAGTYFILVSTFQDLDFEQGSRGGPIDLPTLFDGFDDDSAGGEPSTDFFPYKMIVGVNIVPTPGAMALAGIAGLAAIRRRR